MEFCLTGGAGEVTCIAVKNGRGDLGSCQNSGLRSDVE